MREFISTIISTTLRVPAIGGPAGDGAPVARQMDAVLVRTGFKASRALLEHVAGLEHGAAMDLALTVLGAVRELVGDHVEHNSYFLRFPEGVPDTVEFWVSCLRDAFVSAARLGAEGGVPSDEDLMAALPWVNLLQLPSYGTYQHTYAELVAAHDELIPSVKDRVTVLHLGDSLDAEVSGLYLSLAERRTPLGETELALLADLARACLDGPQPATFPVRENRAVLNAVRLQRGRELVGIDTVTDVLRLACHVSGGDMTLATPTRFRNFPGPQRRVLMTALENVVAANPGKLGDVVKYARRWQRLGELLHPHEFEQSPHARDVFAVARGDKTAYSLAGRVEIAFAAKDVEQAVATAAIAPGLLLRQLDRALRSCTGPAQVESVLKTASTVVGQVSGRVLCSVREHLANRARPELARMFTNRAKRTWVTPDTRPPLDPEVIGAAQDMLDAELGRRLEVHERLVVDPLVLSAALPLSGAATADGFGVLPRGSVAPVDARVLRFFCYWRQTEGVTDFDLSTLLFDEDFTMTGQLSYTNLRREPDGVTDPEHGPSGVHSGDIVSAAEGATEFIDLVLPRTDARYIVPQVNVFSGEGFDEVAESMFGFMTHEGWQKGMPFEPATVRMRSELRGTSRVALPMVFIRGDDGSWSAKWMHMSLRGREWGNRVEANRMSTGLLAQSVVRREYLSVGYIVGLLRAKAGAYVEYSPEAQFDGPVTYIGLYRPDGLPEGSRAITLDTLSELIPA